MRHSKFNFFSKRIKALTLFIQIASSLAILASSVSYARPEFISIQELTQGESLTGANLLNDSIYVNPAAGAFTQVYSVEGTYLYKNSFEASIIDSKSGGLIGEVGYFNTLGGPAELTSNTFVQGGKVGVTTRLSNHFSLGLDGKYLWRGTSATGKQTLVDGDVGFLGNFSWISFGAVVRNLLSSQTHFNQFREWSLGAQINYHHLVYLSAASFSTWNNLAPYQYGFGFEYYSPYYFSIKTGYRMEPNADLHYWSAGLAFVAPRFNLTYGILVPLQNGDVIQNMVSLAFLL